MWSLIWHFALRFFIGYIIGCVTYMFAIIIFAEETANKLICLFFIIVFGWLLIPVIIVSKLFGLIWKLFKKCLL